MPKYDPHRFPFRWNIADGYPAKGIEAHNSTVFGTFICGGGSSMGYKLAGYHHLGGVELDPKVAETYKINHNPELLYNEDIRDFNKRTDLPEQLYHLDLLDGSPPCSTFSTAGSRDKAWGKEKHFAEGQKLQTLDDLVFIYCDTIIKLQPKCFLLENVSGIIKGISISSSLVLPICRGIRASQLPIPGKYATSAPRRISGAPSGRTGIFSKDAWRRWRKTSGAS